MFQKKKQTVYLQQTQNKNSYLTHYPTEPSINYKSKQSSQILKNQLQNNIYISQHHQNNKSNNSHLNSLKQSTSSIMRDDSASQYNSTKVLNSNGYYTNEKTQISEYATLTDFRKSNLTFSSQLQLNPTSPDISLQNILSTKSSRKQSDDLLFKQNMILKKQNQSLKSQLLKIRINSTKKEQYNQSFQQIIKEKVKLEYQKEELRRNFERLQKHSKELEKKNQIFHKQTQLYKQIIDKIEKRVEVLLQQNHQLNDTVKKSLQKLKEMEIIQQKFEKLKCQYSRLQNEVQQDNNQWETHKKFWINQKQYYKQIIRKLEFQLSLKN